jgi:hypothetical protein
MYGEWMHGVLLKIIRMVYFYGEEDFASYLLRKIGSLITCPKY